jgi:hypothetical protein
MTVSGDIHRSFSSLSSPSLQLCMADDHGICMYNAQGMHVCMHADCLRSKNGTPDGSG